MPTGTGSGSAYASSSFSFPRGLGCILFSARRGFSFLRRANLYRVIPSSRREPSSKPTLECRANLFRGPSLLSIICTTGS